MWTLGSLNYYQNILKPRKASIFKQYDLFICFVINYGFPKLWKCWERQGPNNDEDPSEKFLKILEMRSISTRTHEMIFW